MKAMLAQQGKRIQKGRQRASTPEKLRKRGEVRVNRLLMQLIMSAVLFLAVFVGGRLIPDRLCDVFAEVQQVITSESHFLESVQTLGSAVSEGESVGGALKQWCVDTFLPTSLEENEPGQPLSERLDISAQYVSHLMPGLVIPEQPPLA